MIRLENEGIPNAQRALNNRACDELLSNDGLGDAAAKLQDLLDNGRVVYDQGRVKEEADKRGRSDDPAAVTLCENGVCTIYMGKGAFAPSVGDFFGARTPQEGLLLVLLHELAHANGLDESYVESARFNQKIVETCIAPLLRH